MLDLNRPVQLRDGTPARIVCTDRASAADRARPLCVLVTQKNHQNKIYEDAQYFSLDGRSIPSSTPKGTDLINVPIKKARWAIANRNHQGTYVTGVVTWEEVEKNVAEYPVNGWYIVGKVEGTEIEQ